MRSLTRIRLSASTKTAAAAAAPARLIPSVNPASRLLSTTASPRYASVVPVPATSGPPPDPPAAMEAAKREREAEDRAVRVARRKEHVKQGRGRFWKVARVEEVTTNAASEASGEKASTANEAASGEKASTTNEASNASGQTSATTSTGGDKFTSTGRPTSEARTKNGDTHLQVLLDSRALRHPTTRAVLQIPARKKLLAHALAVEWDQLQSVRQATQGHRMPLMSLVCRAVDLEAERSEAARSEAATASPASSPLRSALIDNLLRYLDTDSLLCWAPPDDDDPASLSASRSASRDLGPPWGVVTLRQMQERTAIPILAYLSSHVWPGIEVKPVLGLDSGNALFPTDHPPEVRAAVRHWLWSLDGWQLAGVERATLAGKSLVTAARLVTEWGGSAAATGGGEGKRPAAAAADPFTVDDAVNAANIETAFQTAQWGEVDDTHDVDKADLRRHFGSVVLLVQ